jgi:hypothetical protein
MSNVVRLVSGGSIQVRTGVIQGIGPQGPRGVAGPQGPDGEQGPVGDTGPQGQILQLQGMSTVATNNPLSSGADTVIAFGSVSYDDLSAFTSTSNITLTAAGDYLLSAWLRFDAATATKREVWFQTGATTIARKSVMADTGIFYVDLAMPFRAAGGEVVNVHALSGVATGVSQGSVSVTRVGSGPPGPVGPQGIQGPIGATGAQGPQGVAGTANAGFSSYALLLPH